MEEKIKGLRNDRRSAGRNSQNAGKAGSNERESAMEVELKALFHALDSNDEGLVSLQKLADRLDESGISKHDPRLRDCLAPYLQKEGGMQTALTPDQFISLLQGSNAELLRRTLQKELVIPNFSDFRKDIMEIFDQTKDITEGEADESLPHPGTGDQPAYAVSICTVDGQLLQLGDHEMAFSIQSICKPVNYAIALEDVGEDELHQHVGVEPGNEDFDHGMVLNDNDLPHNPLINSGAIMTSSMIKPEMKMEERLEYVMEVWKKLCGDKDVAYKHESFEAERSAPHKNFALAHLMQERGAFPDNTDLGTTIDFYLKCCAIEVEIDKLAQAAATLANFGVCPGTGRKVFQHDTVRNTLSLMLSSGMYDHSGEFAFWVGLPAKSGIAGGLMVVVPNLMGIAVYSPPLDEHGNSARGIAFCEKLVQRFNFHKYDAVGSSVHGKKDPRLYRNQARAEQKGYLCRAAAEGDLAELQILLARGISADTTNYDGRTALHLAAAEGHHLIVDYLLKKQANINPRDRWGHTPLAEAIRGEHSTVIDLLRENGGEE